MNQSNLLLENARLFADNLIQTVHDMVGVDLQLDAGSIEECLYEPHKRMIVSIHFTGLIQGEYAVAVDEATAANWIGAWQDGMDAHALRPLRDDYAGFLKEALNASVGSSILNLDGDFPDLTFLPPVVVYGELEYPSVPSGKVIVGSELGNAECYFVLNMMGLELGERLQITLAELKESAKETALAKRNIEGMLDAFPSGMVIVGRDGAVQPGYSRKTANVVGYTEGGELGGIPLLSLLGYAEVPEVAEAFQPWLEVAYTRWELMGAKNILEMCPVNERLNGRDRLLHFTWIPRFGDNGELDSFMLIIDDYTEKRRLEQEMQRLSQQHEQNMELVTQVLNLEPDEISEFLYDSAGLLSEAKKTIRNSSRDRKFIESLYRTVHTLKGNSGQYQFKSLQQLAANIERELANLRNTEDAEGRDKLEFFDFSSIDQSLDEADGYLQRLEELQTRLGSKEETIEAKAERSEPAVMVPFNKIQSALEMVRQGMAIAEGVSAPQSLVMSLREAGKAVAQMREVPIANFGFILETAVERLAHRLQKEVQFAVSGDLQIDIDSFRSIHRALVHLINNALDHGIESPDLRRAHGKMVIGVITLKFESQGDRIRFFVEDDGCGIDLNEVRRIYGEKTNVDAEILAKIPESELLMTLFSSGFTTRTTVTDLSGRGVGLDAVRTMIDDMDGTITIHSALGKGTRFEFDVPAHRIKPSVLWNEP